MNFQNYYVIMELIFVVIQIYLSFIKLLCDNGINFCCYSNLSILHNFLSFEQTFS